MRPFFLQLACSQGRKSRTRIIDLLSGDVAPRRDAALSGGASASLKRMKNYPVLTLVIP